MWYMRCIQLCKCVVNALAMLWHKRVGIGEFVSNKEYLHIKFQAVKTHLSKSLYYIFITTYFQTWVPLVVGMRMIWNRKYILLFGKSMLIGVCYWCHSPFLHMEVICLQRGVEMKSLFIHTSSLLIHTGIVKRRTISRCRFYKVLNIVLQCINSSYNMLMRFTINNKVLFLAALHASPQLDKSSFNYENSSCYDWWWHLKSVIYTIPCDSDEYVTAVLFVGSGMQEKVPVWWRHHAKL